MIGNNTFFIVCDGVSMKNLLSAAPARAYTHLRSGQTRSGLRDRGVGAFQSVARAVGGLRARKTQRMDDEWEGREIEMDRKKVIYERRQNDRI